MKYYKDSNGDLLREGSVLKAIGSIAVPMVVVMIVNAVFSYLDIWYISRLGRDALHAMDIIFPYLNLSSALVYAGMGTGVCATVARQFGTSDDHRGISGLVAGLIMAVTGSIILVGGMFYFHNELLGAAGQGVCRSMAEEYCLWYFFFFPVMACGAVVAAAMRGTGNAAQPALYSTVAIIIKALLTPLLTYSDMAIGSFEFRGLALGMSGAAIAGGVSYCAFLLLLLRMLFKNHSMFNSFTSFRWPAYRVYKQIARSAFVAAQVPVMASVVIIIVISVLVQNNPAAADAFSLGKRFELYLIQFAVCLGCATMVVLRVSMADGNRLRAYEALITSLKVFTLCAVPIGVIMFLFSGLFYSTLTTDVMIISEGANYFTCGGLSILSMTGMVLLNFCFQGIGKPLRAVPFLILSIVVVQGGGCWLLQDGQVTTAPFYIFSSLIGFAVFVMALYFVYCELKPRPVKTPVNLFFPNAADVRNGAFAGAFAGAFGRKVLICLIVLVGAPNLQSFNQSENVLVTRSVQQDTTTFSVTLTDPVKPKRPKRKLKIELLTDKDGFPYQYKMPLMVDVCLDGLCKMLRVTLYWDAIGNYSHLEYPPGFPLTKNEHDKFTPKEYERLDAILKNSYSILGTHPLSYFIGSKKGMAIDGVDAVTAATPIAVKDSVVSGAAYTSWALWHWANGVVVKKLVAQTDTLATTEYIIKCLNSKDPFFTAYALDFLKKRGLSDPRIQDACFMVLRNSGMANCERALKLLEDNGVESLVSKLINCYGRNAGSSRLILKFLERKAAVDAAVWGLLAARLKDVTDYTETNTALLLLEKHAADDKDVRKGISDLLSSKSRFIARRAKDFLN